MGIYNLDLRAESYYFHPECSTSGERMPSANSVQSSGFDPLHRITAYYGIAASLPFNPDLREIQTFCNYSGLIIQCRTYLPAVNLLQSHDIRLVGGNHIGNAFR
jgi:hypothetical protein